MQQLCGNFFAMQSSCHELRPKGSARISTQTEMGLAGMRDFPSTATLRTHWTFHRCRSERARANLHTLPLFWGRGRCRSERARATFVRFSGFGVLCVDRMDFARSASEIFCCVDRMDFSSRKVMCAPAGMGGDLAAERSNFHMSLLSQLVAPESFDCP